MRPPRPHGMAPTKLTSTEFAGTHWHMSAKQAHPPHLSPRLASSYIIFVVIVWWTEALPAFAQPVGGVLCHSNDWLVLTKCSFQTRRWFMITLTAAHTSYCISETLFFYLAVLWCNSFSILI